MFWFTVFACKSKKKLTNKMKKKITNRALIFYRITYMHVYKLYLTNYKSYVGIRNNDFMNKSVNELKNEYPKPVYSGFIINGLIWKVYKLQFILVNMLNHIIFILYDQISLFFPWVIPCIWDILLFQFKNFKILLFYRPRGML